MVFLRELSASAELLLASLPGQFHRFQRYLRLRRILFLVQFCDPLADFLTLAIDKKCLSAIQQSKELALKFPDF